MKKYTGKSMIKKTLYAEFIKSLNQQMQKEIIKRIDVLIEDEKIYCDKGNYQHLCDIFSTIALYEILQSYGMSEEKTFETISQALYKAVEPTKKVMQFLSGYNWFWYFIRSILPLAFKYGSGYGWKFTWFKRQDENEYRFEVNQCIYQKIFKKRNLMHLGAMICKCDIIMYGNLKNTDFQRKGTLCYKEKLCDFKFIRYKKDENFIRSNSQ